MAIPNLEPNDVVIVSSLTNVPGGKSFLGIVGYSSYVTQSGAQVYKVYPTDPAILGLSGPKVFRAPVEEASHHGETYCYLNLTEDRLELLTSIGGLRSEVRRTLT